VAVARAPPAAVTIRSPEALLHELQIHQMELEVQNGNRCRRSASI
jgi:hypothetical protein